jgi:hypothetical protein
MIDNPEKNPLTKKHERASRAQLCGIPAGNRQSRMEQSGVKWVQSPVPGPIATRLISLATSSN